MRGQLEKYKCFRILCAGSWKNTTASVFYALAVGKIQPPPYFMRGQLEKYNRFRILCADSWENTSASVFYARAVGKIQMLRNLISGDFRGRNCLEI